MRTERAHDPEARRLVVAAVEGADGVALPLHAPHQAVDIGPAVAEHEEHVGVIAAAHDVLQEACTPLVVDLDRALANGLHRGVPARGRDLHRVLRLATGQLEQRRREGRREEQRLAILVDLREDLLDVLEEADLEHLVGLVEDDELGPGERQEALAHEIEHATWGPDHDLGALLEGLDLGLQRLAADHQGDLHVVRLAELRKHVVDLLGQLTGRREHQPEHRAPSRVDLRHHGRAEREGLAGPRLRLRDHVTALEDRADGERLDRRRARDAHLGDRALDRVPEVELAEGLDGGRLGRGLEGLDGGALGRALAGGTTASAAAPSPGVGQAVSWIHPGSGASRIPLAPSPTPRGSAGTARFRALGPVAARVLPSRPWTS